MKGGTLNGGTLASTGCSVLVLTGSGGTLSGFASPVENMPDWLQWATLANPLRHFLVIVKGLFLKDMPAREVLGNLWPLALIALLTLSAATWLFQRRLG